MVSICIAYYNRRRQLLETLKSFNESAIKNFEIIIVDDGSDDSEKLDKDELQNYVGAKISLLEIPKDKKTWYNSCIAYNIAFSASSGDKIIYQNPETYHLGDIISFVEHNLNNNQYYSFQTIALNSPDTEGFYKAGTTISERFSYLRPIIKRTGAVRSDPHAGTTIWYNHKVHRPVHYHFVASMTRANLYKLGGFDERYQEDHSWDDNEILTRIGRLGLQKRIVDNPMAVHLYHEKFLTRAPHNGYKNGVLYNNTTLREDRVLIQELNFENYKNYLK